MDATPRGIDARGIPRRGFRRTAGRLVRAPGADDVVDYTRSDFADGSRRYDVIVDIGGNGHLSRLRRALTPTGTLVSVGGEQGGSMIGGFGRQLRAPVVSLFVSQRLAMLVSKEHHSYLEALRPLIDTGQVTPALDRTYPLADAPDAMRRSKPDTHAARSPSPSDHAINQPAPEAIGLCADGERLLERCTERG